MTHQEDYLFDWISLSENIKHDVTRAGGEQQIVYSTEELQRVLADNQTSIHELRKDIKSLQVKFQREKNEVISIIGVLTSVLTFISVEIQILKSINDSVRLVGFSLFFFALLAILASLPYLFSVFENKPISWRPYVAYYSLAIGILLLGCLFIYLGWFETACKPIDSFR